MFDTLATAIVGSLTLFINSFSGLLQISVYLGIATLFCYALGKCRAALGTLCRVDFRRPENNPLAEIDGSGAPLALVAAASYCKTKRHYLLEKREVAMRPVPPDGFIRDAAFQYSERHFEEKFLAPIATTANLMPPLGFIGTIIGMVVHFLGSSGGLNSHLTVTGVATALYTTFIGLVCYTVLEVLLKAFAALGRRRIEEGLAAVAERVNLVAEKRAA